MCIYSLSVCVSFLQRPTAQELLKHKFLKQAKKTSYLVDLIDRYSRWKASGGEDESDTKPPKKRDSVDGNDRYSDTY